MPSQPRSDIAVERTQELQIVQAFSSLEVPERIIRESNIKELIQGLSADQQKAKSDVERLSRLRQEKNDGNFLGNWLHGRQDKIQEAQLDLSSTIGQLTQKSSQLLVVNTAISKVLSDQQNLLLQQQGMLQQQADALAEQNQKILDQQVQLGRQQEEIKAANQGLLEAKGLTQEQAQQLVGCVKLVREAEQRIESTHQRLRLDVTDELGSTRRQCLEQLAAGFSELEQHNHSQWTRLSDDSQAFQTLVTHKLQKQQDQQRERLAHQDAQLAGQEEAARSWRSDREHAQQAHQEAVTKRLSAHESETQRQIDECSNTLNQAFSRSLQAQHEALTQNQHLAETQLRDALTALGLGLEQKLDTLWIAQQRSTLQQRWAIATVAALSIAALSWQIALHFAWV